ncbi:hypothetical protein [Pseudomonas sp. 9Ag]|uniref:hypothetical protein n=1 Tax=Pseudomonas sp. 9Ag TaxID=2653167 RepID=UPI0012F0E5A1|nr:hypothetical protein [Pseudomonas sp. 9Ag]VXC49788.1 hypothetical protein PSEUDO9AG_40044 [Pseudomonas sp. 9Ag]
MILLASDAPSQINGAELFADGGASQVTPRQMGSERCGKADRLKGITLTSLCPLTTEIRTMSSKWQAPATGANKGEGIGIAERLAELGLYVAYVPLNATSIVPKQPFEHSVGYW